MFTLYEKIFKLTTQPSSEQFPFGAFDKAENSAPAIGPKGNLNKKKNSELLVFFDWHIYIPNHEPMVWKTGQN